MQILTKRKKALANFTQAYRSDIYADEVWKTLILVATDVGWKILYELVEN